MTSWPSLARILATRPSPGDLICSTERDAGGIERVIRLHDSGEFHVDGKSHLEQKQRGDNRGGDAERYRTLALAVQFRFQRQVFDS